LFFPAFILLPKDNSGELSHEEFAAGLKKYGMDLTDGDIQDLVTMIDISGDGQIDLEEFEAFAKAELEMMHLESVLGDAAAGDNPMSSNLAKATHRGTRFQRSGSVQANVKMQGDIEMLGTAAMKIRADLKSNTKIKKVVQSWWDSLRKLSHGARDEMNAVRGKRMKRNERRSSIQFLAESEYVLDNGISEKQFYTLMQSIHRMLDPDGDAVEEDAMHMDWLNDKTEGEERMGFEKFYDSMFELCDLWVDGLSVDKYTSLLEKCADGSLKAETAQLENQRHLASEMARLERNGTLGAKLAAEAAAKAVLIAYAAAYGCSDNGGGSGGSGGSGGARGADGQFGESATAAEAAEAANIVLKELHRQKMADEARIQEAAALAAAAAAAVALQAARDSAEIIGGSIRVEMLLGKMEATTHKEAVSAIAEATRRISNMPNAEQEQTLELLEEEKTLVEVKGAARVAYLAKVQQGTGGFEEAQLAAREASVDAVSEVSVGA
jgi:hypothetical protein